MEHEEQNEVAHDEQNDRGLHRLKINWLAILVLLMGLVAVGVLLGKITDLPPSQTLVCPAEDWVEIVGATDHVVVYCQAPPVEY